ncbi:MAG TPA: DNA methyltransferase [Gemmatimonadaceae bacterium]|nr:DNA methyltransferase [Gemmatimonadaceae bacterium]
MRTAAALLQDATTLDALSRLLAPLGISGAGQPLDDATRRTLALPDFAGEARIWAGPGATRALIVTLEDGRPPREAITQVASRLHARAPHVLWLLLALHRDGVAFAAWHGDSRPPRVRSLIVDRARLVDSDAESLCALAAAACDDDVMLHLRWTEILGRDALTRRFYRELEQRVEALADSARGRASRNERRELALLQASRLLFIAFLQAKGWMDGRRGFLADEFDRCMAAGGAFHRRVLRPLVFGTLNTPRARRAPAARAFGRVPFLNGGLFAESALERRHRAVHFGDEAFGGLVGDLFGRYRFTAREDAATLSEAAVDPEMLGKAFESLMAADERHASGAFFTPHALVAHVTGVAIATALAGDGFTEEDAARMMTEGVVPHEHECRLRECVERMTLLDPACGSGAFLVHALERLTALRQALGDTRPPAEIRRAVLTRSIFGVDANPMAVWLCELRLWLAVVIESEVSDPMQVAPLPNLDRNVRVGDSLAGAAFATSDAAGVRARTAALRVRYSRSTGARKEALARMLDREERRVALTMADRALAAARHARREALLARRAHDLFGQRTRGSARDDRTLNELRERARTLGVERRRIADGGALPFSFSTHFADIAAQGGFTVTVGNPPWVRLHRIPADMRTRLRATYRAFRTAPWMDGAATARAGAGFSAQVDLAALFLERALDLAAPGGAVGLLVPSKLWSALAGGGVRRLILEHSNLTMLEDLSDAPPLFDAAVYPSLVVMRRRSASDKAATSPCTRVSTWRRAGVLTWRVPSADIPLDPTPGSPWLLLPPPARRAFEALAASGVPLAATMFGRPLLGVKCGCNEAYVVEVTEVHDDVARVRGQDGREHTIERALLRPIARGEDLAPWRRAPTAERILWTHDERGAPLPALPPLALRWLHRFKRRLRERTDARGTIPWWSVFRVEGARRDLARVVWADLGRTPRAIAIPAGSPVVPLNTCYVVRCPDEEDSLALAALLNSPVAAAWLHVLAEPARGNYRRYMAWVMARLPIPHDWKRARRMLAPLGARARETPAAAPGASELTDAVLGAYGMRAGEVSPLLTWVLQP